MKDKIILNIKFIKQKAWYICSSLPSWRYFSSSRFFAINYILLLILRWWLYLRRLLIGRLFILRRVWLYWLRFFLYRFLRCRVILLRFIGITFWGFWNFFLSWFLWTILWIIISWFFIRCRRNIVKINIVLTIFLIILIVLYNI